jgi:putative endonuclease
MLAAMERVTSTEAQRIGDAAERQVGDRLEAQGWTVLARNLRIGRDEVDLLAVDPGPPRALVVVEVRRRNRRDFGLAEETLDFRKRVALRRAVGALLARRTLPDGTALPHLPLRVDLGALDVDGDGRPSVRHHRAIGL